jgi:hypothetical protein
VLGLKPAAENLGISLADLARQVREGFYGAEVQRIPRTREDVRVMVRYPEGERLSVDNLNEMRVRTPAGDEVPFATVAEISYEPGYMSIDRLNRKRTLEVSAEVVEGIVEPRAVVNAILRDHLPGWQQRYPGLRLALDGELQEESDFMNAMIKYLVLAMLVIYALMAIPFRSYFQPLLVLTAIPFGIMGAIFGHLILNWQVSMFSFLGVIACAGVVVNDNLVLIDRINQLRLNRRLGHIADPTRLKKVLHNIGLFVHREGHQTDLWSAAVQASGQLNPTHLPQREVDQCHIRLKSRHQLQRCLTGIGLTDHLHPPAPPQQRPHPGAHNRVVVDKEDSRHKGTRACTMQPRPGVLSRVK